ncbi:GNAT family N-acetyltransferase [Alteromonas sp. a30]|uniref:GNAT family N-acetyltransferase n=1 Tax=Alteromonas sp. a30 TaxID=2730917 RepID=UPI00227E7F82|nr:GNAT family N-acetyltransferase [Alteromonas sp. a30]MCY7295693.1 GNAT family N-acetyltransferase [Alteromonas sp. a30]
MNTLLALETQRLNLRQYRLDDAAFIHSVMNDADFIRFIGDRGIVDEASAISKVIEPTLSGYKTLGFGMLVVEEKSSGEKVGLAGILKRDFLDYPDLGYAFAKAGRGKGYALEATQALMQTAKQQNVADKIVAIVDPANASSIALLEKLEFRYENEEVKGIEGPVHLYLHD